MTTVDAVAKTARELSLHHYALASSLAPVRAPSSTGHAGGKPGSRPPIRLDVSDLLDEIAQTVHDLDLRATDVLGFSIRAGRGVQAVEAVLQALPDLAAAVRDRHPGSPMPDRILDELERLRREARACLALDPPLLTFDTPCPECGERRLAGRVDVVFCRNRMCGYECGRGDCICACTCDGDVHVDCRRILHRTRWGRDELALLAARLDEAEEASA